MRHLLDIDDLQVSEIDRLLERARHHWSSARRGRGEKHPPFVSGLLFMTPSLRTRIGFAVATARLDGASVEVAELRGELGMTEPEALPDTIRVMTGMTDVVVMRVPGAVDRNVVTIFAQCPVVNGGDGAGNHPTQSLIDLMAIEEKGPLDSLRIGVCGDVRSRVVQSLLKTFRLLPPRSVRLMCPDVLRRPTLDQAGEEVEVLSRLEVENLDILYMAGLPGTVQGTKLGIEERAAFMLDSANLELMSPDCIVLSPMPMIDEISAEIRMDPRIRMYHQSDLGVPMRMAILEFMLGYI